MSRMKTLFAVLMLAAIGGVSQAHAATLTMKVIASGSSAMWQATALGAYNSGTSIVSGGGTTCHWTSKSNVINLTDTRPTPTNNDPGTLWVVEDNACGTGTNTTTNVWAYLKVDSVVGNRCYFAQPQCNINGTSTNMTTNGNQISVWPDGSPDSTLSSDLLALFEGSSGIKVTAAASDIRPEDAAWAACRVNSAAGASTASGSASDGADGLGYNSNNPAGQCPTFVSGGSQSRLVGSAIQSGQTGCSPSCATANVLAFNITGHDPFNNTLIPAFTTYAVGAAPMVFIFSRNGGQLSGLRNASELQLQAAFSGTNCDASAFGLSANPIAIHLREPLSGTMNTTEATVFRRPTTYADSGNTTAPLGQSQELNTVVAGTLQNPLKGQSGTCAAGLGARYRGVGTGEVVGKSSAPTGVYGSFANYGYDGIAYTFFSYGNVSSLANNTNYGYIALNGVDPIFASYGTSLDPAQPNVAGFPGVIPGAANLPASCAGSFPCNEAVMWSNGFSFPNLRNGTYRAWSLLRFVSGGTNGANAAAMITAAQKYVVSVTPDYVPAVAASSGGTSDLGLKLLRSHYQQKDGNNVHLGATGVATNSPEKGGDMGGAIIPTLIGVTTYKQVQLIQNQTTTSDGPALRPAP